MHRQRQRLSVEVARRAYAAGRNGGDAADLSPSANFAGESLRGLGLVDERHLGSIAQRQRPAVRARSRDFRRGPGLFATCAADRRRRRVAATLGIASPRRRQIVPPPVATPDRPRGDAAAPDRQVVPPRGDAGRPWRWVAGDAKARDGPHGDDAGRP